MLRFVLLVTALLLISQFASHHADEDKIVPLSDIERQYTNSGPSKPSRVTSSLPCDRKNNICDIWYPSDIGQGAPRPAILWANGTANGPVEPEVYDYLLSHIASWGFVVIATRDPRTGYGDTVLDTLSYLHRITNDQNNMFYNRVNFERIGAAGHSQGATGAINAMLNSSGKVRTSVAFQLPQQRWCSPADLCVLTEDLKAASAGSIFYVGGTRDFIISPDRQWLGSDLNSLAAYYDATPDRLLKVKGLVKGANHNDLLGKPDCKSAEVGGPLTCTRGVQAYLGISTAWFVSQLKDSRPASEFFRTRHGAFFSAADWTGQVSNIR